MKWNIIIFICKRDEEDIALNQKIKGIVHNAFYTRNERKESLKCLDGLPQSADMDMYDFEFDKDGALTAIHKKVLTE